MSSEELCNICGSKDYKVIYPPNVAQVHQIVQCMDCGLLYAYPQGQVDIDQIENYDPAWILENLDNQRFQEIIRKQQGQVRDYQDTKSFLAKKFPETGSLLEIGSGYGYLCDYFRESGWNVTGLEPNEASSMFAQHQLKINSVPSTLENANLVDNSFDVILMMHVIEHLSDPLSTLKLARRKLKNGGIFVLETPRYDTISYKLLKKRERSLSCDGHIFFFTSDTLKEICAKAGFEVLKLDYVGRSLSLERLLWNIGVISKNENVAKYLDALSRAFNLKAARIKINIRDMQRIYLRKQDLQPMCS